MNNDIVTGRNPVLEALRSGRDINKIFVAEGAQKGSIGQVISQAKKERIQVQYVPKKKLDALAEGVNHQGVLAYVAAYDYADIEDVFDLAKKRDEDPFFLVLDEIEDPHNLGSILRTADAAGAHGVIIPKRRAVGLTSAVAKASTGAIEYVPVVRVTNIVRTIEDLKARGVWFVATDAKGDQDYTAAQYDMPIGLVIGSEGKGIGRLVKEKCDFLVSLPMKGKVTSLNASVAAGLLMYEVFRQRRSSGA
ncbi:23S rRNA (guanosine(2251)-2'-O)-methyltransferase RlmB [Pseudalkalibacillus salsuginis]|uniref:23S rRNA (guanosine(2251)-2'-O)-methyltransferase RlmB n=1 Tax=Pseudalkalibacillus salsuginis TaxID=2910972 RepID=UPI001F222A19|nr:23S rRNA (guanosine(2251)-2'-O)-methyltransferase RlmB [Pseudalkalibacillus salsuginis]MCF6411874.1 23S rRNA (guanosine(2251)-2'-O)-methyltransferase RlmB [Pseudalkalibacillus salsuginis]